MTTPDPVRRFLDLSTAHLKPKTRHLLSHGWSPAACDLARSLGCDYVLFDCDAVNHPNLPIYDDPET